MIFNSCVNSTTVPESAKNKHFNVANFLYGGGGLGN